MRANVVSALLVLLLVGLVGGIVWRGQTPHVAPALGDPAPAIEGDASVASADTSSAASGSASTDAEAQASAAAATPPSIPPLDRPLRVMTIAWELAAPGIMANGGVEGGEESLFARARLEVTLGASPDAAQIENALARGGGDPAGADVIIVPLPIFVAAYPRLEVLEPRIFFVTGFARGGEVVAGPTALDELDRDETVTLHARAPSSAALLGLFAFDAAGVPLRLVDDDQSPWVAVERRPSQAGSTPLRGRVLLTSADASRLIPHVAVARARFLREHTSAAAAWIEGWLEGQQMVAADPEAAARAIADAPGAPTMLTILNDLRVVEPAALTDNARMMGLAGRGAVTLPALFERTWAWWRQAGLITEETAPTARPSTDPVSREPVAHVARRHRSIDADDASPAIDHDVASDDGAGGSREAPVEIAVAGTADGPAEGPTEGPTEGPADGPADGPTEGPTDGPADGPVEAPPAPTLGAVLLVERLPGGRVDAAALTSTIGWLAGIFPRAALEVSVHPGGALDEDATRAALARARERFGLEPGRLATGASNGRAGTVATVRVRRTP